MGNKENESDTTPNDTELVRRSLAGEEEAFQQLVLKYQQKVYGVALGILRSHEDALDVAQEVFIKAYNKLGRFRGGSAFYTWLYRIAVNLAIDCRRKKMKVGTVDFDEEILDDDKRSDFKQSNIRYNPRTMAEGTELRQQIMAAIESLPPDQKATIMLRELEDMSYEDIAKVMKCSKGTVMSRLHYGRKKLQEILRDYLYPNSEENQPN